MTTPFLTILLQEASCPRRTHEQEVRLALQRRIFAALESIHISYAAQAVLTQLVARQAFGRSKAVSIERIQGEHPSLTDRVIKAAVKELVEVRGVPVGSSRSGACGYYLIVSDEDAAAAVAPLLSEIRSLAHRVRVLSPMTDLGKLLNGQLSLEVQS